MHKQLVAGLRGLVTCLQSNSVGTNFHGLLFKLRRSPGFSLSLMFPLFPFGRLLIGWLQAARWGRGIPPFQGKPKPRSRPPASPGSPTQTYSLPILRLPSIIPSIRVFQWVSSSHQVAKGLELQLQHQFSSVQSLSRVRLFATPWTVACQSSCLSPAPRVYSNSCPLSQWCHPSISSSVLPFSSHLQSFSASGSFQMSQFFESGGQSIKASASASVLPMNIQDGVPLGWTAGSSCSPRDSQESSPTPQFKSINSWELSFLYSPTLTSIHGVPCFKFWRCLTIF